MSEHAIRTALRGHEDLVSYAKRSVTDERRVWTEPIGADETGLNASVHGLCELVDALCEEIESLRTFKRSVDEALNSGDGSYRP